MSRPDRDERHYRVEVPEGECPFTPGAPACAGGRCICLDTSTEYGRTVAQANARCACGNDWPCPRVRHYEIPGRKYRNPLLPGARFPTPSRCACGNDWLCPDAEGEGE